LNKEQIFPGLVWSTRRGSDMCWLGILYAV